MYTVHQATGSYRNPIDLKLLPDIGYARDDLVFMDIVSHMRRLLSCSVFRPRISTSCSIWYSELKKSQLWRKRELSIVAHINHIFIRHTTCIHRRPNLTLHLSGAAWVEPSWHWNGTFKRTLPKWILYVMRSVIIWISYPSLCQQISSFWKRRRLLNSLFLGQYKWVLEIGREG